MLHVCDKDKHEYHLYAAVGWDTHRPPNGPNVSLACVLESICQSEGLGSACESSPDEAIEPSGGKDGSSVTINSVPFSMNTLSMTVYPDTTSERPTRRTNVPVRTWNMFQHRRRRNVVAPVLDAVVDAHRAKGVWVERYNGSILVVEDVLLGVLGDLFFLPCPVPVNNVVPIYAPRVGAIVARLRRRPFATARKRDFEVVEENKGGEGEEDERDLSTTRW